MLLLIVWVITAFYYKYAYDNLLDQNEYTQTYVEQETGIEDEEPVEDAEPINDVEPVEDVEPVINFEPIDEFVPRYGFTDYEITLMARLLCGDKEVDGDGEYDFDFYNADCYDQISLVLCVIMNRVRSPEFPDTVEEVIFENDGKIWQFSPVKRWKGEPNVSLVALEKVREWCEAYDGYYQSVQTIPEDHLYFRSNGTGNVSRKDYNK